MMHAYDSSYLENARVALGRMLNYAVYDLGYSLAEYWSMFTSSPISKRIECGDSSVLAGKSGVELALLVTNQEKDYVKPTFFENKSDVYWLGWALAYYQWTTGFLFSQITQNISIDELRMMYSPYHEMDIRQFCDKLSELRNIRRKATNLKTRRLAVGLSQSELARMTDIPVRTIQQYDQGQKDINNARATYVIALARALYCEPSLILE